MDWLTTITSCFNFSLSLHRILACFSFASIRPSVVSFRPNYRIKVPACTCIFLLWYTVNDHEYTLFSCLQLWSIFCTLCTMECMAVLTSSFSAILHAQHAHLWFKFVFFMVFWIFDVQIIVVQVHEHVRLQIVIVLWRCCC